MDAYSIEYTNEALQDLRDIYDYISNELKSPETAAAQIKRIRNEIRSLDSFPKRYAAVEWKSWASRGLRRMPVDHFVVLYIVSDEFKAVQVVRIFYGKRNIPDIISREQ